MQIWTTHLLIYEHMCNFEVQRSVNLMWQTTTVVTPIVRWHKNLLCERIAVPSAQQILEFPWWQRTNVAFEYRVWFKDISRGQCHWASHLLLWPHSKDYLTSVNYCQRTILSFIRSFVQRFARECLIFSLFNFFFK